jgi:hypothetical protein
MSFEAIHWPGCCWLTIWPDVPPVALAIPTDEPLPAADAPEAPAPAVEAEPDVVEGDSDCPAADEPEAPEVPDPVWLMLPDPPAAEPPDPAGLVPTVAPVLGCIAEEPEVADPEPVAAGRSVAPDGAVPVCAKAGAAANAVATRQAAICDFNIDRSPGGASRVVRAHRVNATRSGIVPPSSTQIS